MLSWIKSTISFVVVCATGSKSIIIYPYTPRQKSIFPLYNTDSISQDICKRPFKHSCGTVTVILLLSCLRRIHTIWRLIASLHSSYSWTKTIISGENVQKMPSYMIQKQFPVYACIVVYCDRPLCSHSRHQCKNEEFMMRRFGINLNINLPLI